MKILIAMSGGVDSSVAAGLLCKDGNECIGATMKLYHNEDAGIPRAHTCCSLDDVEDARSVCYKLGIPYYVFNFSDDFGEKIIDKFVRSYEAGLTPNPCIDCNRYMKFDKLYQRAEILSCDHIATGHYARITFENGQYQLRKALDETKDQSYVLYDMTQQRLARTLATASTGTIAITHSASRQLSTNIITIASARYATYHTASMSPQARIVAILSVSDITRA